MTDLGATNASDANQRWLRRGIFAIVCGAVIALLACGAEPGLSVLKNAHAKDCYYNLLIQGFQAGHLNVKKEVPAGLARLADPYDPAANAPYIPEVGDMSYYDGKLYLYFGITPALTLYWPYLVLTGHYLPDAWAGLLFCSLGFLAGAVLINAVWRRYFPQVSTWVAMTVVFVFGIMVVSHETEWLYCRIYEVALSGGFAFGMVALAAIWAALHRGRRQAFWMCIASVAYGLAVGSRPSLLFGAVVLLVPVIGTWRTGSGSKRQAAGLLAAALIPLMLIGAGLMVYNFLRFGNPVEFGYRYEVTALQQTDIRQFSLRYLGSNFLYYFLEPMHWAGRLHLIPLTPQWIGSSPRFGLAQYYGGLFVIYPVVLAAIAAPLAWKRNPENLLRWFALTVFLAFAICALTLCLFFYAYIRYELDYLPALMLLAAIGIFALENGSRDSPPQQRAARWGWRVLAAWTVIAALLGSLDAYAEANYFAGNALLNRNAPDRAIARFRRALLIEPDFAEARDGLGNALFQKGAAADAVAQYKKALEIKPNLAEAHYNLGYCLLQMGRVQDAITQNQIVLKLDPAFAKAQNDLASCYLQEGRIADALAQLETTVKLDPNFADAHNNLGFCLLQTGHVPEAVVQFQTAVDLQPRSANFRCGLGNALLKAGKGDEAVAEYQKAVELAPGVAGVHYELAAGLLKTGHADAAVAQYQAAVELKPDSATFHWGLANALSQKGLTNEAIIQFRKAIELNPSLANKLNREIQP